MRAKARCSKLSTKADNSSGSQGEVNTWSTPKRNARNLVDKSSSLLMHMMPKLVFLCCSCCDR